MSAAAGLWRIPPGERDLLRASTAGVGEMIKHAADRGAREILLGLGGSATNDGGLGMARTLGYRFFAGDGAREIQNAGDLLTLTRIAPPADGRVSASNDRRSNGPAWLPAITVAVDVRNPLLGPRGATRTFGPQKGGSPEQLEILEAGLQRLAEVAKSDLGTDFRQIPGAGAAGGLGFGLMTFSGAAIRPGFEIVAEFVSLTSAIRQCDAVITGEGRLDEQTLEGKAPAGVARIAREAGKRIFAIVGSSSETAAGSALFDAVVVLARDEVSPEQSVERAASLLQERARELARMM
jgi:glycerate kinase